jgi:hypothetical protein
MKTQSNKVHLNSIPILLVTLLVLASGAVMAQVPVDENGKPIASLPAESYSEDDALTAAAPLTATELEELVGPIALYPDDLLAIVLPASTYPLEIVQAARFLQELETDSSLKPDENWDESVAALVNYPEVIQMMDDDIDWTWRLGEAVISQQAAVIAAVEMFRDRAYAAGNLKSDEYQTVSLDEGAIEIEPADEEIIYVPYYEPAEVVVYQPQPVYRYYPRAYPVYYYPYPVGHHFASGYFWGVTTAFTIGWSNHNLHVYHPSYYGHPYYGHHYYGHYYRRPSVSVYNTYYVNNNYRTSQYNRRDGDYWRPRQRSGSRPYTNRVRNQHYPPGSVTQTRNRSGARNSSRRELGLRERNRNTASNNRQVRVATAADNSRNRSNSRPAAERATSEVRFRERGENVAAARANTRTRAVTDNRNRRQQAPASTRRVASNNRTPPARTTPTRAIATEPGQTRRASANARQTTPARTAVRQQTTAAVAQRSPRRPVAQRSAPRPERTAAAAPQRQASAQRTARQAPNRGDSASKQKRSESSSGERRRKRK